MTDLVKKTKQNISKEQQLQLIRLIKKMLGMGKYASEIKKAVNQEYGLSTRSVERYITRARREMVKHTKVSLEDHVAEAYYFYRGILTDPESTQRERLRARERIDKLLGLDQPTRTHKKELHLDLTPKQIQAMSDEELERTYELLCNESLTDSRE